MTWHVGINREYGCLVAAEKKYPLHILGNTRERIIEAISKYDISKPLNDLGTGNPCFRNLTQEEYTMYFG